MGVSAARCYGRRGWLFGWPAGRLLEENFAVPRFRLGAVSNFAQAHYSDSVRVVRGQGHSGRVLKRRAKHRSITA